MLPIYAAKSTAASARALCFSLFASRRLSAILSIRPTMRLCSSSGGNGTIIAASLQGSIASKIAWRSHDLGPLAEGEELGSNLLQIDNSGSHRLALFDWLIVDLKMGKWLSST